MYRDIFVGNDTLSKMPSLFEQLAKPLGWASTGKGSVELAAIGASVLTIQWIRHRLRDIPVEEPQEDPVKSLKPENYIARRWDSDAFVQERTLERVKSFQLDMPSCDISVTDTASLSCMGRLSVDEISDKASEISLSIPESPRTSREMQGCLGRSSVQGDCCWITRRCLG